MTTKKPLTPKQIQNALKKEQALAQARAAHEAKFAAMEVEAARIAKITSVTTRQILQKKLAVLDAKGIAYFTPIERTDILRQLRELDGVD